MAGAPLDPFNIDPSDVTIDRKDKIGEGGFGEVYKAMWRKPDGTSVQVAAKYIADTQKTDEINFLSQLRHENIISYYGSYEDMNFLIMITELAVGDLATRLDSVSSLPAPLIERWIKEAAFGLQYLHERGLVHCDVKTANYLLMVDEKLKLADFGLAKPLDKTLSTVAKGTYRWMAPEVFDELVRSKRSDVFAYGMVVWSICTTERPFATWTDFRVMDAIIGGQRPVIPDECRALIKQVIETCWQTDYKSRPSMDMVVKALETEDVAFLKLQPQEMATPKETAGSGTHEKDASSSSDLSAENVASFYSNRAERRRQRRKQQDTSS